MFDHDIFWLAINIYHEARGESTEGQEAIGHVCFNRAEKRKMSIKDIVLQPFQFSWHNRNKFPPITEYESLLNCLDVANKVAIDRQRGNDPMNGADHYFADYIDPPEWAKGMTMICKIGKHIFYRK